MVASDLANPCGGVECGPHGSCSTGLCTCTGGYTGERCEWLFPPQYVISNCFKNALLAIGPQTCSGAQEKFVCRIFIQPYIDCKRALRPRITFVQVTTGGPSPGGRTAAPTHSSAPLLAIQTPETVSSATIKYFFTKSLCRIVFGSCVTALDPRIASAGECELLGRCLRHGPHHLRRRRAGVSA